MRTAEDLKSIDGLVIPGGESTTMLKLVNFMDLKEPLREFAREKPVFGTCAGAILLAREVRNPEQESFGIIDLTVERNGYGRQIDSRVANIHPGSEFRKARGRRAIWKRCLSALPSFGASGPGVNVLAQYEGDPVLVEQGRHLVATFHPELTQDSRVHKLFLSKL